MVYLEFCSRLDRGGVGGLGGKEGRGLLLSTVNAKEAAAALGLVVVVGALKRRFALDTTAVGRAGGQAAVAIVVVVGAAEGAGAAEEEEGEQQEGHNGPGEGKGLDTQR